MACISYNIGASTEFHQRFSTQPSRASQPQCSFGKISSISYMEHINWESSIIRDPPNSHRFNSYRFRTTVFNTVSTVNGVFAERMKNGFPLCGGGSSCIDCLLVIITVHWLVFLDWHRTRKGFCIGHWWWGKGTFTLLAWQRSPSCDAVFCAPGNAGISMSRDSTCIPDLDIFDSSAVISFCQKREVGMVVVGPGAPLVSGLVNDLVEAGIPAFGPSSEAAALEGSKDVMKKLCDKYAIPTAKYQTFTDPSAAKIYIKEQGAPIVVKADGLAAGKGVIVAVTLEEAYEAVDSMLVEGVFGSAGCRVIVEEYLEGEEASFFALVDGENAFPLESARNHKRVGDGDTGPNTGGMGAYSPAPVLTEELQSLVCGL